MKKSSLNNIDLHLLKVFIAVFENRNVGLAAVSLEMSQPGLSIALNRMRKLLKDPLFEKQAHGVSPTQRAKDIYASVKSIVNAIETEVLQPKVFDPSQPRLFNISLSDIGEAIYLPAIVNELEKVSAGVSIRSVSLPPVMLRAALGEGEVDLAAGYFPDIKTNEFLHRRIGLHSFTCIMRVDHPLSKRPMTLEDYLSARHVAVRSSGRSHEVFEDFLNEQKMFRPVSLVTAHFMSLPIIISRTNFIATVPQAIADFYMSQGNLAEARLPFKPPVLQGNLYWSKKLNQDPANIWLRHVLTRAFNSIGAHRYDRNARLDDPMRGPSRESGFSSPHGLL
jgi:DNA-binding transcriptional LysR family regulator